MPLVRKGQYKKEAYQTDVSREEERRALEHEERGHAGHPLGEGTYPLGATREGEYISPTPRTPEEVAKETPFISPEQPIQQPVTAENIVVPKVEKNIKYDESLKDIASYTGVSEELLKKDREIIEKSTTKVGGEYRFDFADILKEKYKDSKLVDVFLGRSTDNLWGDMLNDSLNFLLSQDYKVRQVWEKKNIDTITWENTKKMLGEQAKYVSAELQKVGGSDESKYTKEQLADLTVQSVDPSLSNYINAEESERKAQYAEWLNTLPKSIAMINVFSKYVVNSALFIFCNLAKYVTNCVGTGVYMADGYSKDDSYQLSRVLGTSAWEDLKTKILPAAFGKEAKQFWSAPIKGESWTNLVSKAKEERALHSSQKTYLAATQNLINKEMLSRYHAGEDPYLIGREIENPLAEAVAQAAFDPFNYVGGFLSGVADAKRIAKIQKLNNVQSGTIEATLLYSKGSKTKSSLKVLDSVLQTATKEIRTGHTVLGRTFGLDVLNEVGKRNRFKAVTHNALMAICKDTNPLVLDETLLNYVRAYGESDDAIRLTALAEMRKHPAASVIFSENGKEAATILTDLLRDSKGHITGGKLASMLEEAQKDSAPVAKFLELLDPWMESRLGGLFPSYYNFIKKTDKIKEFIKGGGKAEDLSSDLKRFLVDGKSAKINPATRFLIEADHVVRMPRSWAIKVMAKMYFNNPAFVARNADTTALPMLVDTMMGCVPYFGKARKAKVFERLGTPAKAKTGFGLGTYGATVETKNLNGWLKWLDKITDAGSGASNWVEKSLAGTITSWAQEKMWNNGVVAMVRDGRPSLSTVAELSDDEIKLLGSALHHELDVDKAVESIVGGKAYLNMSPDDVNLMRGTGLLDDVLDNYQVALKSTTPEETFRRLNRKVVGRWRQAGNQVLKEPVALDYTKHPELVQEQGADMLAVEEKLMPKETLDLASRKRAAFYEAHDGFMTGGAIKGGVRGQMIAKFQWIQDNLVELERIKPGSTKKFVELTKGDGWFNNLADDLDPVSKELQSITPKLEGLYKTYQEALNMGRDKQEAWEIYKTAKEEYLAGVYERSLKIEQNVLKKYFPAIQDADPSSPFELVAQQFDQLCSDSYGWANVDELQFVRSKGYGFVKGTAPVLTDEAEEMTRLWQNVREGILDDNPAKRAIALRKLDKSIRTNGTPEEIAEWEGAWLNKSDAEIGQIVDDVAFRMSGAILDKGDVVMTAEDLAKAEKAGTKAKIIKPLNNPIGNAVPSARRAMKENVDGLDQFLYNLEHRQNFQAPTKVANPEKWYKAADILRPRATEVKAVGLEYADAMRTKTALDYGAKYGIDGVLAYIYPFQFWYSRSYYQWIMRIAEKPGILSNYARYRNVLEKIHAGQPDWLKYSLNTKELFGMDEPVMFNWEATLNPMYGLVGADFEDANKQSEWLPATVDNLGKFGPSVYTPVSMGIGIYYALRGEKEKARIWGGGRMFPITGLVRGATALMGVNNGQGLELDPALWAQSNQTHYDDRAISAKLVDVAVNNVPLPGVGTITLDQVYAASDPNMRIDPKTGRKNIEANKIWDAGVALWMRDPRTPWLGWKSTQMVMGSTFGIGFKGYTAQDMIIGQAYREYEQYSIGDAELSPAEAIQFNATFNERYPFWEPMLLTRKSGIARDRAYAYSVLGRIPPGETNKYTELIGMPEGLLDKFYSTKGHFEFWDATNEYAPFIGAIGNLATILATPPDTIKHDYNQARIRSSETTAEQKILFGDDILDKIDEYYNAKNDDEAEAYLLEHPEVQEAMDWKANVVLRDPVMSKYYGGVWTYEQFMTSIMNANADSLFEETKIGDKSLTIRQLYSVYQSLEGEEKTRFLNDYPQVGEYRMWRTEQRDAIGRAIEGGAKLFPDQPAGIIRPDFQPQNDPQRMLYDYIELQKTPNKVLEDSLRRANELKSETVGDFETAQYIRIRSEKLWNGVMNKREEYYRRKAENPSKAAEFLAKDENADLRAQMNFQDQAEDVQYWASHQKDVQGNIIDYPTLLGNELFRLVEDYIVLGEDIPQKQRDRIEKLTGMSFEQFIGQIQ